MRFGKHVALAGAVLALGFGSGVASAQPPGMMGGESDAAEGSRGLYLGLGLEQFRIKGEGTVNGADYNVTTRPVGLTGRAGYNFLEWLSLEAHASVGVHDDPNSGSFNGGTDVRSGETELKHHVGVAAVPEYRFVFGGTTVITVFGLAGYNDFEFEGEFRNDRGIGPAQTASYTLEDDGEYWGAGLRLDGQAAGLRLQYTRYFDESDVEIEGYSIGVNVYF
ncbi:hypothetical protein PC39_14672 [Salinisphaera sp. PC39]|uniref:outer membrane beta-barrel protein n=1 Tax=Salinisphaera sp. PC39 TaxID=1304156 RepID=UPI00334049C8